MALGQNSAWVFLPFVLPICLWVAYTDLSDMRITNRAVLSLGTVFVLLGPLVLPFDLYLWRLAQLGTVLVAGIVLNAGGAIGAGDAKFAAAAAPYIAAGDLRLLMVIFTATLLAAVSTHRIAKYTPLRRLAPQWRSWNQEWDFPMGFALGGTLGIYLTLGATLGT